MKKQEKRKFPVIKTLFILMVFALPVQLFAQPEGFDEDVDDETPQTFIDGFIGIGIAAGAAYGFSKLKDKK